MKNAGTTHLKGVNEVVRNLNKIILNTKNVSIAALIEASIIIQRDADKGSPKTPVDTRNLQHSWFATTVKSTKGQGASFTGKEASTMSTDHSSAIAGGQAMVKVQRQPTLLMGYTANYASFVHEMGGGKSINWSRPGSGAKWFELSLSKNTRAILDLFVNKLKIK